MERNLKNKTFVLTGFLLLSLIINCFVLFRVAGVETRQHKAKKEVERLKKQTQINDSILYHYINEKNKMPVDTFDIPSIVDYWKKSSTGHGVENK